MPLLTPLSTPPLLEGDSLTSDEFLRRWEEIPDLKRAELIDGIVYMPSPVSLRHQDYESFLNGWLNFYASRHPDAVLPRKAPGSWAKNRFRNPM